MDAALDEVIQKINSGRQDLLREAENQTNTWENENFAAYLFALCTYLCHESKSTTNRFLAGVLFRGTLDAKDKILSNTKKQKWLQLVTDEVRANIKSAVLSILGVEDQKIRQIAAQVISSVALVELPHGKWPELIRILLENVINPQTSPNLKQSSLDVFGYVLDEINPEILSGSANDITTAVIHGMRPQESNINVKRSACRALYNALDFCNYNFDNPNERNVIMNVIMEAAVSTDEEIHVTALGILVEVAALHYDKLATYMQQIFSITLGAIKDSSENVTKQAIEFWCTICEEEIKITEEMETAKELNLPPPKYQSQNYVKGALTYLIPLLTEVLTKQESEADQNDWTVSMAGGTCLNLIAQTVEDEILPHVIPFIERHITSQDWRFREASVHAFAQILEGPHRYIEQLVPQVTPVLLQHMKDPKTVVKDTTAFTIGRILKFHHTGVIPFAANLLKILGDALHDKPKIAANAAWAIHNFAFSFQSVENNPLQQYFTDVVQLLLLTSDRPDSDSENLRRSVYEALNVVLATTANINDEKLEQLLGVILERLEKTFLMDKLSQDDQNSRTELQALLLGVLQVIIQKVDKKIKPYADHIMSIVLRLFKFKGDSNIHEETFLTVAALSNAIEIDFLKYMNDFQEYLYMGLNSWQEYQVCNVAIGLVGDISRVLGIHFAGSTCNQVVLLLLQNLQNKNLDRSVKPYILSAFGDIALAIGGYFSPYLEVVLAMLKQASETVIQSNLLAQQDDMYDHIDYMNLLEQGIFEAYTGIIQGLKMDNKGEFLYVHVHCILQLVHHVASDPYRSEDVTRCAVGICGDIAVCFGAPVMHMLFQGFVEDLIKTCQKNATHPKTLETCLWVCQILSARRNMATGAGMGF